ncbi:hypothetical protein [Nocardia sp. CA-135398]|uniref:hypothetical protein n=1 Tax=Nocardia sp. CA-135398 TaxID=3239977 RepID=UPI003D97F695
MHKVRWIGAAVVAASGLMLGVAGTASAAESAPAATAVGSGSSSNRVGLLDLLATGSSDSGSSASGGITLGAGNVAGVPLSTGSAGTGSSALCLTNPTTAGCPK